MSLHIRKAQHKDKEFVLRLIPKTLSEFYGGDHNAHAERIFSTHISGGQDRLGFFSTEQKMFIADDDGTPVGLVHLVGKRQGTYKISPLIVVPGLRKKGIGKALLEHADSYVREKEARQLYCTLADTNKSAKLFFLSHGFVVCGSSDSQYKSGISELMLYKLLHPENYDAAFDREHISVLPYNGDHHESVTELLLKELPKDFSGIDQSWVNSLFDGYERRFEADVNSKFKLLFVARDSNGQLLGVVGATPKKGEPVKLMPLVATTTPAFVALITDVPNLLEGRKVYAHCVPDVDQTIALQQRGWRIDGLMPAAYHKDMVTQQWSYEMQEIVELRLKQQYLEYIKNGSKRIEVRVLYPHMEKLEEGQRVRLRSRSDSVMVRVTAVRRYSNFDELLTKEDYKLIAPELDEERTLELLRDIYDKNKEDLGPIAIHVELEGPEAGQTLPDQPTMSRLNASTIRHT